MRARDSGLLLGQPLGLASSLLALRLGLRRGLLLLVALLLRALAPLLGLLGRLLALLLGLADLRRQPLVGLRALLLGLAAQAHRALALVGGGTALGRVGLELLVAQDSAGDGRAVASARSSAISAASPRRPTVRSSGTRAPLM